MDNRVEVIVFKVGDLIRYREDHSHVGLIVKQHRFMKKVWYIKWLSGLEYSENEMFLEVICK